MIKVLFHLSKIGGRCLCASISIHRKSGVAITPVRPLVYLLPSPFHKRRGAAVAVALETYGLIWAYVQAVEATHAT